MGLKERKPSVGASKRSDWDLFIAHASEDKIGFVRPLADRLIELGVRVWYDEFEISPGDSLIKAIDRGLANSAFGLMILSPAFLHKPWPDYERRGLTARELNDRGVVIPIWRDVTWNDVVEFSPTLADKHALIGDNVDKLALELLRVVRSDLFENLARRAAHEEYMNTLPVERIRIADILTEVPLRHETLPEPLMLRLLLIYEAVHEVSSIPFAKMVQNFQREEDPEREARIWEFLAATYLHIVREDNLPLEGRREVFGLALKASLSDLHDADEEGLTYTKVSRIREVRRELTRRINVFGEDEED